MNKVYIIYIFLHCLSTYVWCEATLEEQNIQNELNPVNDYENNDGDDRAHEKRTIFNSEVENYGWAKHVGVHPSGFKYVLGIGPVDLKYVPVVRNPFRLVNHRPRWPSKIFKPFRPLKPSYSHGWKPLKPVVSNPGISIRPVVPIIRPVVPLVRPTVPVGKPVVPILKPIPPPAQPWPNKSWNHDEWHQKPVVTKPAVALTPVNVVPVQPVPQPQVAPVVPVRPVFPLQPVNPVVSLQPVNPVNQLVPVQSLNPVVQVQPAPSPPQIVPVPTTISTDPWVPLAKPAYPWVPQQQPLLEVTKPNLPVLPLGASFPSPVLQQAPAGDIFYYQSPGIVLQRPQLINQHPHHISQNPPTVVEIHGNQHLIPQNGFINFPKLASIYPQYAPQFTQALPQDTSTQIFTNGVQVQQTPRIVTTPFDAGQPIPQVPQFQQLPHQTTQLTQVQQLPQPDQQYIPQGIQYQQLPNQEQQLTQIQQFTSQGQQVLDEQYLPPAGHGQLPLEGETSQQQQPQNPFIPAPQSNFLFQGQDQQYISDLQQQQFQSSNSIQPGQTDVQTPLYLPPHNTYNPQVETFNNGFSSQFLPNQDDGFRPSPTLEPPYNNFGYNRREDSVSSEEIEESSETANA